MYYESAVTLFEGLLAADPPAGTSAEDVQEMKKDCVHALIAMIEIWMSDLWCVQVRGTYAIEHLLKPSFLQL